MFHRKRRLENTKDIDEEERYATIEMSESTKKEFDDKPAPTTTDEVDSKPSENEPTPATPGPEVMILDETKGVNDQFESKDKEKSKETSTVKNSLYESGMPNAEKISVRKRERERE